MPDFCLWLRPFDVDKYYRNYYPWYTWAAPWLDIRGARPDFETELEMICVHVVEKQLSRFGLSWPMFAVGERRGNRGAARTWLPSNYWKPVAERMMLEARIIFFVV